MRSLMKFHRTLLSYAGELKRTLRYGYSRKELALFSSWPIACVLVSGVIWGITFDKIKDEYAATEKNAYASARSISKSYSEQLLHLIDEIDQITLSLKYHWERSNGKLSLEDQAQAGLYPPSFQYYLSITDRNGKSITSTLGGASTYLGDRPWFKFHQSSPDLALRVDDKLSVGRRSGLAVIRFTRRLNAADGSFNGGITIGVLPSYFASFRDENSLGPSDFISVRHENGELFTSEKGQLIRGKGQVHREPPLFIGDIGVMRVAPEKYKDNKARILAWHRVPGYPLVSYVGLAEDDLFASHTKAVQSYRETATILSVFLFAVSLAGMFFSLHLTRKKRQAEKIKATYHLATDAAREGFYVLRAIYGEDKAIADFVVEDCNEYGALFLGFDKSSLVGTEITQLYSDEQAQRFMAVFRTAMETGFYEDQVKIPSNGSEETVWIHRILVCSEVGLAVTLRNISEAKAQEHKLLDMAHTDPLTGLPNRHWLISALPSLIDHARSKDTSLAVLFTDLDGFKKVNDSLGHLAGDILLKAVAARLKSTLRSHDYVVRLGGDEFTIVLTTVTGPEEVTQIAQRIIGTFREPFNIAGSTNKVSTSVGVSLFPGDGDSTEQLLQKADIAMYAAKKEGKGTFQFYDQRLYERTQAQRDIERDLERAIAEDQFVMHYQPRVNTLTGEITGLEALIRWQHPERGWILPGEFIPLAEQKGTIIPISECVLEKVCAQIAAWQAENENTVPISVNISASQFSMQNVAERIAAVTLKHGIPASAIEVEITETAMAYDTENTKDQIAALTAMGVTIHVDDFGTGYSSLSRLQEYRMQVLKIDRAFTSRLGTGKEADTLFRTIVSMAKSLNMSVIAEGVETLQQLQILQSFYCDEVQGYRIAPPLPAHEIPSLLHRRFLFPQQEDIPAHDFMVVDDPR